MGFMDKITEIIPCVISRRTSFMTMTFLLGSFFLVEIVVGYMTNSMALIADAFHMLSDVASLIVGYLALKYSTIQAPRDTYTYGYARAEVLGALVNAVFLVALCFSIFIEALKRLVILEEIQNPLLVFIVGAVGLVVNIFGMFLFHQTGHGHTHGGMSHSHSHGSKPDDHGNGHVDPGKGHGHSHGNYKHEHGHSHGNHGNELAKESHDSIKYHSTPVNDLSRTENSFSPSLNNVVEIEETKANPDNDSTKLVSPIQTVEEPKNNDQQNTETISINRLVCAGSRLEQESTQNTNYDQNKEKIDGEGGHNITYDLDDLDQNIADEGHRLLPKDDATNESSMSIPIATECSNDNNKNAPSSCDMFSKHHVENTIEDSTEEALYDEENQQKKLFPTKFRSAAALNIHAVYLHILGDALGSVIVMISALIIIYAEGTWTLYVDPAMSIIMVVIILKTSIPLLIETSKILMNSVPHHIQVNDLKKRLVQHIPQIKNVHELHIWQLAGEKIIASAHVKLTSPSEYEEVTTKIKDFFHTEGIHSTTIQIEYEKDDDVDRRGECMVMCSLDSACDHMMCCQPGQE